MQFPVGAITEVTAPNNVPFVPGQNVTGLGSGVPPELLAVGIPNAIIFYSNDWNPANTVPTAKFKWIAAVGGALVIGYGYCQNPSVSQVATIVYEATFGINDVGTIASPIIQFQYDNSFAMAYWEQSFDAAKEGFHAFLNRSGQVLYQISYNGTNHVFGFRNNCQLLLNNGSYLFWSSLATPAMGTFGRGRVGQNRRTTFITSTANSEATANAVLSTIAPILNTNTYLITFKGKFFHTAANVTVVVSLRFTTDNTEPIVTSPYLCQGLVLLGGAGTSNDLEMSYSLISGTSTDTFRVAAFISSTGGATLTLAAAPENPSELNVIDTGSTLAMTGTVY